MPRKCYFVYILASLKGTLYVGVTDNLIARMCKHKKGVFDGFTKRYKIDRLVYFEVFTDARAASAREQQVKAYRRDKKVALVEHDNKMWEDLTERTSRAAIGIPRCARNV